MTTDSTKKSILMYSTSWCSDCIRAKMFFDEHKIDYTEIDIDYDSDAEAKVLKLNKGLRSVPTIIISQEGKEDLILVEPDRRRLEETFLK
ncbi:MAG: glutaredoxin family protein [Candidatus Dojkabacteria bacterium]|uniref:Glutaredoxin family protein n=1 Tax=Candidatus Dojkabacteria bacterium TaxID=2099670 RepID=A0A952AM66_9BACT|nr:glutaredoxin family protein [Candidatus Dojkabacteria bacterium]WKZ27508.1 MAG: glutaredoxin family protein [Candidatus Dojkabacteria bacterium]